MTQGLRKQFVLALVALVAVSQAATISAVVASRHGQYRDDAQARIEAGREALATAVEARGQRVLAVAERLAGDGALGAALAAEATSRIEARLAGHLGGGVQGLAVISPQGAPVAAVGSVSGAGMVGALRDAPAGGRVVIRADGGEIRLVGLAPVTADKPTAWVVASAAQGAMLASAVKSSTDVDVSFWAPAVQGGFALLHTTLSGATPASPARGLHESDGRLHLTMRLGEAGGGDLRAVLTSPEAGDRGALGTLVLKLVALTLLALSIGIGVALLLVRSLAGPLGEVTAALRRMEKGDYETPIDLVRSDELGDIVRVVNRAQRRIASREEEIMLKSARDAQTGLPTRSAVNAGLQAAFDRAAMSGVTLAALLVDLTRTRRDFPNLNARDDEFILREVSKRLSSNMRISDTLGRTGDDRFLIVMEDADERLAPHFAEFLVGNLSLPIKLPSRVVKVTPTIGVALYPQHCEMPDALLRRAEIAVREALKYKRAVLVYEPGQDEEHLRQLAIVSDLPNAIRNDELFMLFQPKVAIGTGQVVQVEALTRWNHPQMGFLPPDEFVPLIEQSDKISMLTDWVMKTAVSQSRRWSEQGLDIGVAINLSAHDLLDTGLPERLALLLRHYLVQPSSIVVEVTESAVMRDVDLAIAALTSLKENGIRISLDDFGTGHSSLALLKQLPIDELKIDKSFVLDLAPGSEDEVIVKSTVDLGHNMGLKVTAEGVETRASWELLREFGCDMAQGYMISRPVSNADLLAWCLKLRTANLHKLDYSFMQRGLGKTADEKAEEGVSG